MSQQCHTICISVRYLALNLESKHGPSLRLNIHDVSV